jgi:hypothetical protein
MAGAIDIQQLVSRLQMAHFRSYLLARGWQEQPSRYLDHVYFETPMADGSGMYELYIPTSENVPKYRTRQMRAIYKLCGIEDREPYEITQDLLACDISEPAGPSAAITRMRVQNVGSTVLHVRVSSPQREYELLPEEAVELKCEVPATSYLEIERGDASLTIVARKPK